MNCLFGKWIAFLCARSVVWVRSCCREEKHRKEGQHDERTTRRGDGAGRPAYLGQPPADSAGLLGAHVERELLALVQLAEVGARLVVDDRQDAGDRLADSRAAREQRD